MVCVALGGGGVSEHREGAGTSWLRSGFIFGKTKISVLEILREIFVTEKSVCFFATKNVPVSQIAPDQKGGESAPAAPPHQLCHTHVSCIIGGGSM